MDRHKVLIGLRDEAEAASLSEFLSGLGLDTITVADGAKALGRRLLDAITTEPVSISDRVIPATVRIGFSWQGGVPSVHNVIASVDGDYILDEREWHANMGLEYFWVKTYGARIGYQIHREDAGLTLGFGLRWKGRFLLDYAWGLGKSLSDQHRITVTYRFAGVPPSQRGRQRRPFIESIPERERLRDRNIDDMQPQFSEPRPRPRAVPRERRTGVPGWIY